MAFSLLFVGNRITGGGTDRDGPFSIEGEVDGLDVYLIKSYPWLIVRYDGRWNGIYVAGRSTIGPIAHGEFGTFEIWPEDGEGPIDLREAEQALTASK